MGRSRRPMIDAANSRITESRLKPLRVFSQIMQQAREFDLRSEAKWSGELLRFIGHLAEMCGKWLPIALIGIGLSVRQGGCVREVFSHGFHCFLLDPRFDW